MTWPKDRGEYQTLYVLVNCPDVKSLRSELISGLNAIIHAKHGVGVKIGPTFNVLTELLRHS